MNKRVVVTGMGMVSPLGIGVKENWEAICQGKSGIAPVTRFDVTDFEIYRDRRCDFAIGPGTFFDCSAPGNGCRRISSIRPVRGGGSSNDP